MLLEILAVCLIGNKRSLAKQKQKIWGINANIGALTTFPQSKIKQLQFSSVAHSYPNLCDPMNCSTPDLLFHHQLLESTQTHVH